MFTSKICFLCLFLLIRQTGLSPLAAGQWKKFLAVYAGFWMFNNIVRPMRVGVAVAISPQFEKIVENIRNRFQVSKTVAVTMTVLLANLVGTTLFMSLGIALAALLAGVPVFPPKIWDFMDWDRRCCSTLVAEQFMTGFPWKAYISYRISGVITRIF